MVSELGRRLAAGIEAPARARTDRTDRTDRTAPPLPDDDPDFALTLSSESLRIADARSPSTPGVRPTATDSSEPTASDAPLESTAEAGPSASGPARRAIEAYREIARAPLGERIRILA